MVTRSWSGLVKRWKVQHDSKGARNHLQSHSLWSAAATVAALTDPE